MQRTIFETDHDDFRRSVREFVNREVLPNTSAHVAAKALPRELWERAGELDLLGLNVPAVYGGSEAGDYRFNAVLAEELAKANMAVASCLVTHADIVAPYIVELGTEQQKARWLPGLASGDVISCIAMTEPGGGSDLASLTTSAVRRGDDYVINGSKTFITNGYSADLVLLAARTTPDARARGITLFLVDATAPGVKQGRKLDKVGLDEADTAELYFDDLTVSSDHVLGEVDSGFMHMMQGLAQERVGAAITNLANARQILEETIEYVGQRKAFGQAIGHFQYNKFLLADLVTRIDVTQAFVDQCIVAHTEKRLTAVDAAKVKLWTSEVQNTVIDHCVQLHGGYGFMNEYRVARAWRDARVTRIWAGTNEIMKEIIGRDLGL